MKLQFRIYVPKLDVRIGYTTFQKANTRSETRDENP